MSRKTGRRRENDDEDKVNDDDKERGLDERFTDRDIPEPGYRSRLNQFLTLAQHNASRATFYLYRIVRGKKAQLSKYFSENDIPDEHEVGLKWGSGDYDLVMTAPPLRTNGKSIISSYLFTLDSYYDELRMEMQNRNPAYRMQQFQPQDSNRSMVEAITLLQTLISTLAPLFRPTETAPDIQKLFSSNYDVLSKVMRQSMENSVDLMTDYQRKVLMLKEKRDDDGVDEEGIIEKLIPYIKDWLPMLIGGGAPARQVGEIARKTAMFKEISKNKKIVNKLIEYLDKEKGETATDSVLSSLGLKRQKRVAAKAAG